MAERKPAPAPAPKQSPDNLKAIELIGNIMDESQPPMLKKASVEALADMAADGRLTDQMKDKAGAALMELLRGGNPELGEAAVKAIGHMRYMEAWPRLVDLLRYSSGEMQQNAAIALGAIKSRQSVGPLIGLAGDRGKGTRMWAIFALGEIRSPKSIGALVFALDDRALEVRINAADALGKHGDPEALPALRKHCRGKLKAAAMAAIEEIEKNQNE